MIIGIAGKIGSGKDLVGRMISYIYDNANISYENYKNTPNTEFIHKRHFADSLKMVCSILTDTSYEYFSDRDFKNQSIPWLKGSPSIRKLLQDVGTCLKEKIDPDLWIKLLFKYTETWDMVIIPDVRFQNEVDAIHNQEGIVIHLIRDDRFNTPTDIKQHISETELDTITNFDFEINNNGSEKDLFNNVLKVCNKVL